MTTLPQTTTIRLPRPAGTMQLAPSGVPGPVLAGVPAGGAAGMSSGDLWRVLRNHIWLILAILVISVVAGFGAFKLLVTYYPLYTATGYIQVQPNTRDVMNPNRNDSTEPGVLSIEQKTQAALLKSDSLLTKVLKNEGSELRNTSWFKKFNGDTAAAKDDFLDNYSVTPLAETRLGKVEFTYSDARACQTVVKEMCTQHIADESERIFLEGQRQSQQLNTLKNQYMSDKTSNDAQLAQKRAHLSAGGGAVAGTRVSAKELQLEELRHSQTKADMEFKSATSMLESIKNQLNQGIDPSMVTSIVDSNQLLVNYRYQRDQAERDFERAKDKFGESHPLNKQFQKEFERASQKAKDFEAEVTAKARAQILESATLQANA